MSTFVGSESTFVGSGSTFLVSATFRLALFDGFTPTGLSDCVGIAFCPSKIDFKDLIKMSPFEINFSLTTRVWNHYYHT